MRRHQHRCQKQRGITQSQRRAVPPPTHDRHAQRCDGACDIQAKRETRPGNQQRPERAQAVGLVRPGFEQRQNSPHIEHHVHPATQRLRAVIESSGRKLRHRGEDCSEHSFPGAGRHKDDACGQSQLRLEDQASQDQPGEKFTPFPQQKEHRGEAGERQRRRLAPGDQVKKAGKCHCQESNQRAVPAQAWTHPPDIETARAVNGGADTPPQGQRPVVRKMRQWCEQQ